MLNALKVGIIGFGNMGRAVARGLIESGAASPEDIRTLVRRPESLSEIAGDFGVRATLNAEEFVSESPFMFLCVKSGQALETLRALRPSLDHAGEVPMVSMCAGVPIDLVRGALGKNIAVIKAIASIDIQTTNGFTVLYSNDEREALKGAVKYLFEKLGTVIESRTEKECDTVSSMSATIPAFIATTISALVDAGIYCGVPKDLSYRIATEVMSSTARSIRAMNLPPDVYRQLITSPGGVVIKGVHVLEKNRIRSAFTKALETVEDQVASYHNKLVNEGGN